MNKPKPIIQKIDFGEYEQEVKRLWDGEPPSSMVERWEKQGFRPKHYYAGTLKSRQARIQKLLGYGSNAVGLCSKCKNFNVYILKEQIDGAVLITRYCSDHLPEEHKTQIPK